MQQLKHIMFDLDGTLLALGFQDFVEVYMKQIAMKMATFGYDPERSVQAIWKGTKAMMENDGTATNRQVFWSAFEACGFDDIDIIESKLDGFYINEFQRVSDVLRESRNLRPMVDSLKTKGYTLSLATNPVFPLVGVETRLSWLGLTKEDFAVVTSYENSRFCKPNLTYFEDVLTAAGFTAEESMMVGNDIHDDMPAKELGLQVYLVTDVLEHSESGSVEDFPHGTFNELLAYFERLPAVE